MRLLAASLLLLAAPLGAVPVSQRPEASASGPYVRLGEVAEVGPAWRDILLGEAPAEDAVRILTRGELASRLAYLGMGAELGGSEETRVRRGAPAAPSLEETLCAEIDRRLRERGRTLAGGEWSLPSPWESAEVLEVSLEGESALLHLRGRLPEGGLEEFRLKVSTVRVRTAVVALRALKPGQTAVAGDLGLRELPESVLPEGAVTDLPCCLGRKVLRPVPADGVLTFPALALPRLVARGSTCVLEECRGAVRVRCQGRALADGRVGELIQFEVADSGKRVRARVRAAGEAELRLEEAP